jgi:tetratricopeptide (TPR) repeat protein/CHAT domain-containing protein
MTGYGAGTPGQADVEPSLRAAVERFFAAQESEDVSAYLSLWSERAERPTSEQLKYIFDAGDDAFTNVEVQRVVRAGDRARVRVTAHRRRTLPRPGRTPVSFETDMLVSLTFAKEDAGWKLLREAPATDDLAAALLEAPSGEARDELLRVDADLVGDGLISALSRRGSTAAQLQQYGQAATVFERVLEIARLARSRQAEGEALQNIANALYFQRDFAGALQRYNERLAIERERGDDEAVAAALGGVATIRYTFAEYGLALTAYREALAIQDRLSDTAGAATTLISTGNVLYLQGDFAAAIADYRRSRDMNRRLHNTQGESRALEGLGRVFTAQGDFAAALEAFGGVLAEGQARADRRVEGAALQHIGEIQYRLGNLDAARASFDESRQHYDALGDQPNVGRAWQALALTDLAAGRFEVAEQEYGTSGRTCGAAQDSECVAHATVGLAFALGAREKFAEAAAAYARAIAAFEALNRPEEAARAEVGLSQALLGTRDLDSAQAAAVRARHYAIGAGNDDVVWRALVAEARVLRRKGNRAAALASAQAAVAAAVRLQQVAGERPGRSVPPDCQTAFATVVVLQAEGGDAAAAAATAERMRLYALRSALLPYERDVYRGMTVQERDDERASVSELVSLDAQINRERSLPRPDSARLVKLEAQFEETGARRGVARARLFERLPDLPVWRGLVPASSDAELARLLRDSPGAILLQFVVDEDDLVVMTAAGAEQAVSYSAAVIPVARHALAERVAKATQISVLKDLAEWRLRASDVVALLPENVLEPLRHARAVMVIADGPLWRVPFEALPLKEGYLADSRRVSYAGSVTALVLSSARRDAQARIAHREGDASATGAPGSPLVAVAAAQIAPDVRDRMVLTAPGWTIRSAADTQREVEKIATAYAGGEAGQGGWCVLAGNAATERDLRDTAAAAHVLHFAVPFRINAASPLFSAALLTSDGRPGRPEDDGVLEAREIVNLDLRARAAVLSDGGASSMRDALAATPTLAWAWLAAGVPALVLSRWPAEDAETIVLAGLHRRLSVGASAVEALSGAGADVRNTDRRAAPFYWAGWMVVGR